MREDKECYAGAFRAFLTGSHAYGIPNGKSDVDLVVFLSNEDFEKISVLGEKVGGELDEDYQAHGCYPVQFGKLQLLCCTSEEAYRMWFKGTRDLKRKKPVPRDFAIAFFEQLRDKEAIR